MIHIQKNTAPRHFLCYASDPRARFDDMDSDTKSILRNALLDEQGHICAYCMKRLKDKVKIEHYVPRNEENELQYTNLLVVCSGGEGLKKKDQTCDTRKGNTVLHIDPQNAGHMQQIRYKSNGEIFADNEDFQRDLDQTLNLNLESLVEWRKTALEEMKVRIFQNCGGSRPTRDFWERKLQMFQSRANGKLSPYCGILIYYLQRRIRQCGG